MNIKEVIYVIKDIIKNYFFDEVFFDLILVRI